MWESQILEKYFTYQMYHIREGNFPFKEYIISYKKRKFSFQEVDKNWVISTGMVGILSEYVVVLYIVEGVTCQTLRQFY